MWRNVFKACLLGTLVITPLGCEPRPVVVDPDGDDTTVVEERETVIERDTNPDSGVDVNVGGERGIDVGVNRDAADESNQNP